MSNVRLYVLAALLTGASLAIAGGTLGYVAVKGVQRQVARVERELDLPAGGLSKAVATLANFEKVLEDIRGDADGEFGRRAAEVRRRYPFAPQPGGRIDEGQLRRFLGVKRRLHQVDLEMAADFDRHGGEPTAADLLKWNFFSRLQRLRRVQAAALAEQRMSVEEYRHVQLAAWTAAVAAGVRPAQGEDWGVLVDQAFALSGAALDQAVAAADPGSERRRELVAVRAAMGERRQLITAIAHGAQQRLAEVPPENIALLERHRVELATTMMAAVDLDTVDLFAAAEAAGLALPN